MRKGDLVTKCTKTIKITLENYQNIIELRAHLMLKEKEDKTPNDAITYLFQKVKEETKNES
ncbi:MAG: hypothetical protein JXB49_17105 [Bacteroidales bacterium]|nr:hypothetical protein [Bacteroidales bacterium]